MPTIDSSCTVIDAKAMRMTVAAMMPQKIAFVRWSAGRPAAAMPTTMALSPARTMSMNSTSSRRMEPLGQDFQHVADDPVCVTRAFASVLPPMRDFSSAPAPLRGNARARMRCRLPGPCLPGYGSITNSTWRNFQE